ncbi:nitrate- and nitrite sensing domain-containing protein [Streptomyces sp. NBC_00201]|uniref:sensor histidine kinase n=1 Tax=unclassified Streptomyces TaxID=2593676 RepID=UPI0022524332|nr:MULTISPECIES: nitrate- and nitrite sensing domain-containing protein [unclassified Streptomyces]MCX5063167.1 nitrate- and nitrite sensing domain-containing protein [Streptomyces sp. NBC_00452]MCX5251007.1 nitrate- and nitrite sensing domain-containing protein [Streptomyces sp. NBC_00201]MCX5291064.1 nitrate- and nitrite sensing domain-containing protein [Streptomyces sp. NBC_00183]
MARRLRAVLLIPVLVALVLGGLRVRHSVDTWRAADDAVRVAELVQAANRYAGDAINERDVSVVPLLKDERNAAAVVRARKVTDADAEAFDRAVGHMPKAAGLLRRVQLVRTGEKQLPTIRSNAFTSRLSGVRSEESYHLLQHPLMEMSNELGFGSTNQASFGRTLYAISLTQAAKSLTRSIGTHLLVEDRGALAAGELQSQLASFRSYAYLEPVALQEYAGAGTAEDMARLRKALADARSRGEQRSADAAANARAAGRTYVAPPGMDKMISEIADGKTPARLAAEGITPESFFAASTLGFDAYRGVEVHLTDTALAGARGIADDARRDAVVNAALVLASLLIAFLLASWVARTMSSRMRHLTAAAIEISGQRLPALIARLSRTAPGQVDSRLAVPIAITSTDEIGEVARAFDLVHREAVRLATEQALLRGEINTVFSNLSRRNQSLIERQLALITDLEDHETDPDQLANLFSLDHLATRVRRNGENLLVLGGEKPAHQWDQPLPLVDVIRAAASEVEQYERVAFCGIPEAEIHGRAVTDLVHLLSELLENATSFSSPHSQVRVTADVPPDGRIMLEIHDSGIGLPADDVASINHRLANPPTVDADISQHMGLYVVGRLAGRHGIRVQLRPARPAGEPSGTTALVMLPDTITYRTPSDEPDAETLSLAAVRDAPSPRRTAAAAAGPFPGQDSPEARAGHEAWTQRGTTPPPGHGEDSGPPRTKGPVSRRHARRKRGQEQGPDVSRSAAPWGTVE